jgi:hypothetical protein
LTKKNKFFFDEKQMDSIMFGIEIREFQLAMPYLWACKIQCHMDVMMILGRAKSNSLKSISSLPLHKYLTNI